MISLNKEDIEEIRLMDNDSNLILLEIAYQLEGIKNVLKSIDIDTTELTTHYINQ